MKRILSISAIVLVAVIAVAAILVYRSLDDQTEVDISGELERFQSSAGPARASEPGLPEQGVYTFTVEGNEAISRGISVERTFPETATMIVLHEDAGYYTDTKYSEEHREEARYALEDDGAYVTFAKTTVSAGPITSVRDRSWTPRLLRFPGSGNAIPEWGGQFTAGDLGLTVTATRKPQETVTVEGTDISANVFEFVQDITGEYSGDRTEVFWVHPETSLILRYTIESRIKGPTDIDFFVDQTIDSLTPQT